MIRKILYLIFLCSIIAFFVSWLVEQQGHTVIRWQNWEITISSNILFGIFLISLILIIFLDRTIRTILNWPSWLSKNWRLRRRQSGERALSLGMIALAASDYPEAKKQARKAEKLLGSGILSDLLSAQASHGSGDRKAAERYFVSLSKNKDTNYFGHIGLMQLNKMEGNYHASVRAAKNAIKINSKSVQASVMLLDYELSQKNWIASLEHLNVIHKNNLKNKIGPRNINLLAAHICYQISMSKKEISKKIEWLNKSIDWYPEFIEANLLLSKLESERGDNKKAIIILEKAIKILPHINFSNELEKITKDNDGQFVARLSNLANKSKYKDESLLLVSEVALNRGIWASASSFLEEISDNGKTNKYFILHARLAEQRNLPESREKSMREAAIAPRSGGWICENCNISMLKWMLECDNCKIFGHVHWKIRFDKNEILLKN